MTRTTGQVEPRSTARPPSQAPMIAAVWSAVVALVGIWWLLVPDAYWGYTDLDLIADESLVAHLDPALASGLLVALGGIGVAIALLGADARQKLPARRVVGPALVMAAIFGFLVPDMSLLVAAGYAAALVGIPGLVVLILLLAARHTGFRWIALGMFVAGFAAVLFYGVDLASLGRMGDEIGGNLPRFLATLAPVLVSFVGGLIWCVVALHAAGVRIADARPVPFRRPARDWGWWVTIAAASCPLIFAAQRMTWLTPWPLLADQQELADQPGLRMFGLFLGLAAIGGATLTLGLISRWGSIYPRWIPRLGGSTVSPVWPSVTAAVVGGVVTIFGRSLAQSLGVASGPEVEPMLVIMAAKSILWGPLLVVAAYAYHRRRTTQAHAA